MTRQTWIVVLGGYGVFGRRAVERLAGRPDVGVIVAGRNLARAEAAASEVERVLLAAGAERPSLRPAVVDAETLTADDLRALGASILINTVGPFQSQDYRVARTAIAAGLHYIDLADARAFVGGVEAAGLAREVLQDGA